MVGDNWTLRDDPPPSPKTARLSKPRASHICECHTRTSTTSQLHDTTSFGAHHLEIIYVFLLVLGRRTVPFWHVNTVTLLLGATSFSAHLVRNTCHALLCVLSAELAHSGSLSAPKVLWCYLGGVASNMCLIFNTCTHNFFHFLLPDTVIFGPAPSNSSMVVPNYARPSKPSISSSSRASIISSFGLKHTPTHWQ